MQLQTHVYTEFGKDAGTLFSKIKISKKIPFSSIKIIVNKFQNMKVLLFVGLYNIQSLYFYF